MGSTDDVKATGGKKTVSGRAVSVKKIVRK